MFNYIRKSKSETLQIMLKLEAILFFLVTKVRSNSNSSKSILKLIIHF